MKILGDRSTVHVIMENTERRAQLTAMIERSGGRAHVHDRVQDLLLHATQCLRGCLLVEVGVGGASALDALWRAYLSIPVIVISAPSDVETAVEVMKKGAFDCLESSLLQEDDFLLSILAAQRRDGENWLHAQRQAELRSRVESLTPREKQVMSLLTEGTLNKVIASRLGLSRRTVETHRTNVMVKMQATSVAQLINMSLLLAESRARATGKAPMWRRCTAELPAGMAVTA